MTWPEIKPITPPLACFGAEFKESDPKCAACAHNTECQQFMGARLHRIPLSKATFRMLPEAYDLRFNVVEDDPELPHLQRVYILCYQTVFEREPLDCNLGRFAKAILSNVRLSNCSVRMFMLSNMLGFKRMDEIRQAKAAIARTSKFTPWRLTDKTALERARTYSDLCHKEYGTFTVSTLSTLSESNVDKTDIEKKMLNSEICAGRWLVNHKTFHEGSPYGLMFEQISPDLDPRWLAVEDNYKVLVLDNKAWTGTQQQRSHRYAVVQSIGQMKRHSNTAGAIFKVRQDIMPEAVNKVLEHFGYRAEDFEVEDKAITNPLEMWVNLGRALQHWNLINYLHGGENLFDRH